jgi:hypothetical protein
MGSAGFELDLWAIVNGVPAFFGGVMFIIAPYVRRVWPGAPDGLGWFDVRFAWDIAQRRDALLLGVGYVFRGLLFLHVFLAASWVEIRWIVWGNVLFAAVLLLVTLVWGDLFRWRRFSAIGWLFLYVEEPIWMLTLVPRLQAESVEVGGDGLPVWLIAVLLIEAVVTLLVGLWFFFRRPESQGDRISSRILAGFFIGWTGWAVAIALARSWDEAVWGLALDVLWVVGTVAVLVLVRPRARAPADQAPAQT